MKSDIHVVPVDDWIEHDTETRVCWCQPTIEEHEDWSAALVTHHSADWRELHESGALPPASRH